MVWARSVVIRDAGGRHLNEDFAILPPDERIERLEHVIEGLASQVDQLASGQDLLNRVVAERLDKLARGLPPPGGPVRPER